MLTLSLCTLEKSRILRSSIVVIVLLCIIFLYFNVGTPLMMVLIFTLLSVLGLIAIQILEKVKIIGNISFTETQIIIELDGKEKQLIDCNAINRLKIRANSVKGDIILTKGLFYMKKGCNNWVKIYESNNKEQKYQFVLLNEIQYRSLQTWVCSHRFG